MPTKRRRIGLALPPDLQPLVEADAAYEGAELAFICTRIIREHYRKRAEDTEKNLDVLRNSGLLKSPQVLTMDFSGGSYKAQSQSGGQSSDAKAK